jgi:oligopeptide/dipeptide ABC transporter ATP-binding protein
VTAAAGTASAAPGTTPLLEVRDLVVEFATQRGTVRAVDGVDLTLGAGATLGVVGESGCGKSVTSLAILRLLDGNARVRSGTIRFEGRDLLTLDEPAMRRMRGARIAMIFQEPMTSLNPVFTVGAQIAETLRVHRGLDRKAAWARAVELMHLVEIPDPERRARAYPHELSGGMRQRVMIAIAISCEPALLIADEPTTALDVTIQAQILDLLRGLRERLGMGLLLITHDLGVVAAEADEVAIMYAGRIVERAPTASLFANPAHPYTRALLASLPRLEQRSGRLTPIPGRVPDLLALPSGCRFRDRCPRADAACAAQDPALVAIAPGRSVACFHPTHEEDAP